ncbi:MAG: LamG-like jellyroll fold domain-containing protein [Cytophagaceae bacterium]
MKNQYYLKLSLFFTLGSYAAFSQCDIQQKNVTAASGNILCTGSTDIKIESSQVGVVYSLYNETAAQPVSGSTAQGNGNDINLNTGQISSGTVFSVKATQVEQNHALLFDGVDDYVNLGTMGSFATSISNCAVEFWIKTTDKSKITAPLKVINRNNPTVPDNDIVFAIECNRALQSSSDNLLVFEAGSTLFYIRDNVGKVCAGNINTDIYDGQWHHIAMNIVNAPTGNIEAYVDGVKRTFVKFFSANPSGWQAWGDQLTLGAGNNRGNRGTYFSGSITDLRFWSQSRTAQQINSMKNRLLAGNETNLFAYYDFKAGSGTSLADKKGNFNGTLVNMNASAAWVSGIEQVICEGDVGEHVTVTVSGLTSDAGADVNVCQGGNASLNAVAPSDGTGKWEIVEGNSVAVNNINDHQSSIAINSTGVTKLAWVVSHAGCTSASDEVTVTVDVCTGINKKADNAMSIYPNPAQGGNVHFSKALNAVKVMNMQGATVAQAAELQELNVEGWKSGLYLIVAEEGIFKLEVK